MLQFRTKFNIFYYPSISRFNIEKKGKSSIQDYKKGISSVRLNTIGGTAIELWTKSINC